MFDLSRWGESRVHIHVQRKAAFLFYTHSFLFNRNTYYLLYQCLMFAVRQKCFYTPADLLPVVHQGCSFFRNSIEINICECTRGLHFCFTPSLSQSAPFSQRPSTPSQSFSFIWIKESSFFPTINMYIMYDYLYRRSKKLFIFTGVTLLRCIFLSLSFFKQKTEYLKQFSGICKTNLRV